MKKKKKENKEGKIHVTVIDGDRLKAICDLSAAIKEVAGALSSVPQVVVRDCEIRTSDIGIIIDAEQQKTEKRTFTVKG